MPGDAVAQSDAFAGYVGEAVERRAVASRGLFERQAETLAIVCHRMAERFARGGRLIALGVTPAARTDVAHVVVEFVHPVIVGKRALPALGCCGEKVAPAAELAAQVRGEDILVAFGEPADGAELLRAVRVARAAGALTLAFDELGAEWSLTVPAPDADVRQELVEVAYHVLWELVHVFFEHRGLLEGRKPRPLHDTGAAAFLYPFLTEGEGDLDSVLRDVAGSARAKAAETQALRRATMTKSQAQLMAAAMSLRGALDAGGKVLTFGNGGSATDAADLAVDLLSGAGGLPRRPALDLGECSAILTAIANDIGSDAILSRQLIAHGGEGDALVVFSTSGGSANVLAGLEEACRRGLATVALVGYDGGAIAERGLADHVIIVPSQHIPRIQEAQATAAHILRELIERVRA